MNYKTKYWIYIITLVFAVSYLWGWFDFIFNYRVDAFPPLSVKNVVGFGLAYIAIQMYKRQVDY